MRLNKFILAIPAILITTILVGCQDSYRYPCQDPENWDQKQCKKPYCSASGTCPEDLRDYDIKPQQPAPVVPATTTNECAPVKSKGACK